MKRYFHPLLAALVVVAPARAAEVEVVGTVEAGVVAGCLVLATPDAAYNISAAIPTPEPGAFGRVTGTVSNQLSICMQGVILDPAAWEALPDPADGDRDPDASD